MKPFADEDSHTEHDDLDSYLEAHAGFHHAVASLAGNRVLALSLETYGQIVAHHVAVVDDPRKLNDVLIDDHLHIAKVVIAGHPRKASELMEEHLRGGSGVLRERLNNSLDSSVEWL